LKFDDNGSELDRNRTINVNLGIVINGNVKSVDLHTQLHALLPILYITISDSIDNWNLELALNQNIASHINILDVINNGLIVVLCISILLRDLVHVRDLQLSDFIFHLFCISHGLTSETILNICWYV
jgi:hypothetical protein